ncbi:MAG: class I SAM-dependent methyltransferase [Dehalococcoidia bacterium]|nr:class I SAM-dependent methyltransferase [Dehalococcoidia bacterium]
MISQRSRVEVGPREAHHYDLFMDIISLGFYSLLVKSVVAKMEIQPGQTVLDLGSGTGRNDCLIAQKLGDTGRVLGLDISGEMLSLSRKRCQPYPNISFREERIEAPTSYQEEFDKVFISFVFHGFEDYQKINIISNAYQALKVGGTFYIFDYSEFDIQKLWFPLRWAFIHGECQLALEFLNLDLKEMLSGQRFTRLDEELLLKGHLRLLKATK